MSTIEGAVRNESRFLRTVAGLICLGLAVVSVLFFSRQRAARTSAQAFVKQSGLDLRRPEETGPMRFEPQPDLAAAIAVRAALSDLGARPAGQSPEGRQEEIEAGRTLALDAVAARPGWAYHRFLLGRLVYEAAGTQRDPSASASWDSSAVPLRFAAEGAPAADEIWSAFGQMYLDNWKKLSESQRAEAIPVLRRGLQDPRFVSERFLALSNAVGREEAMGLLPENPDLLGAAADSLSQQGDLPAVAALMARRDAAERKRRASDLEWIEGRVSAKDPEGLRAACAAWVNEYPTSELDDPAGRAEAAKVLELWPGDRGGPWAGDPRADLVRFFLDGRESAVSPQTLLRTVQGLSDVPDPVKARVQLRAGDVAGAEELAGRPQNQGAPDWTAYYADLARLLLTQGKPNEARAALERLSPVARNECDALLARRDVARALDDAGELAAVGQRLTVLRSAVRRQDPLPGGVALSICVDPEQSEGSNLDVKIVSTGSSIVRYGWGSGRSGTMFLRDEAVVSLPLEGLAGMRSLGVQAVAGSAVRASSASASR